MSNVSGVPDQNFKPSTIIWDSVNDTTFPQEGNKNLGSAFVQVLDTSGSPLSSFGGLNLKSFDYVERVLTNSTTETYTFKSGGASGTTTNTVVIVYTDDTLSTISTVTKT